MTSKFQFPLDLPPESRKPQKGCKDVFHAYMHKAVSADENTGMPIMHKETTVPQSVLSFSQAMDTKTTNFNSFVHFYEHDVQMERFWNNPWQYLPRLSKFSGFISPDYTIASDMPKPLRLYNRYRNQLVGAWLQSLGYKALCNVRCSLNDGDPYSLAGVPKNSILAIGAISCIKNINDRERFRGGLIRLIKDAKPAGMVIIGQDAYEVFNDVKEDNIPLWFYPGQTQAYYKGRNHE